MVCNKINSKRLLLSFQGLKKLLPVLLVIWCQQSFSSNSPYLLKKIADEDELANAWISTVKQDFLGFIWIGTSDGLFRFDGSRIRTYRSITGNPNTLAGNNITEIYEDNKNQLWVGSSRGISRYNRNSDSFYSEGHWPKVTISDILEDSKGVLYLSSYSGLHVLKTEQDLNS